MLVYLLSEPNALLKLSDPAAYAAATSLAQETAEPEEGGGEAAVEIADVAAQEGEAAVEEAPQVNARTVFGLDDPHVHDIPRDVYVADDVPAARRATTPYLNRDFDRVHDSARLSQTEEADVALVGTQEEPVSDGALAD